VDQEQQDGQQQQPRWRPTRKQLLWASGIGAVLTVAVVVIGYRYDITLWDWLKLLVVPAVIAGGGIWFNRQQRERELEIAAQQRKQDLKIAAQQREQELEIAERRTQDEALQAYLDQMSGMLIPNTDQPSLYKARPGDSLSSVARARTLTVLPRLDGERKARVVQFLYESGLVAAEHRVLDLTAADLRGVDLRQARGANLRGANLSETNLIGANLTGANLIGADLSGTDLIGADLIGANLTGANLIGAVLTGADLSMANLIEADLRMANLSEADLSEAILIKANLSMAGLSETILHAAHLREAEGITNEELDAQAQSLKGATMPNGQKYEDWLKDREGHGKEGENPDSGLTPVW
jgi:uncharacterized protein YjbI with pentapeptide repeats